MDMTPPLCGTELLKIIFDKACPALYRGGGIIENHLQ
jgi:hypothetical protein